MQLLMLPNPKHLHTEKHSKYINSVSLFLAVLLWVTPLPNTTVWKLRAQEGQSKRVHFQTEHQDTKSLAFDKGRTLVSWLCPLTLNVR